MNVDMDNFSEVYQMIKQQKLIERSSFIAIDLQFTGLNFDNNQKQKYDTFLYQKYAKMSNVASKFNIIQTGLTFIIPCTGSCSPPSPSYLAYPFNFYTYPRQSFSQNNPTVSLQSSTVSFNNAYNMDWNRWIRKGIHYVRIAEMEKVMQMYTGVGAGTGGTGGKGLFEVGNLVVTNSLVNNTAKMATQKFYNEVVGELSGNVRVYVEEIIDKIKQKVKNLPKEQQQMKQQKQVKEVSLKKQQQKQKQSKQQPQGQQVQQSEIPKSLKQFPNKIVIQVPKFCANVVKKCVQVYCNQYKIDLIISKQQLQPQPQQPQQQPIPNQTQATSPTPQSQSQSQSATMPTVLLHLALPTPAQKSHYQQMIKQSILGFTLLFEEVWNSGKYIVGHNCMFDLLFMYDKFVDELPREYGNWKRNLTEIVGKGENAKRGFFDTKFLAHVEECNGRKFKKGTSLQQLYNHFKQKPSSSNPSITLAPGFQSYKMSTVHEAGFDSYLTSFIFLNLCPHAPSLTPLSQPATLSPPSALQSIIHPNKSYYILNLLSPDSFKPNQYLFVIAVVLNNTYVPYQELRTMKINQYKIIREQLGKEGIGNDVMVIQGFKEIYVGARANGMGGQGGQGEEARKRVIRFLIRLKKEKIVSPDHVMSLESWVKMRAQAAAVVNAMNKNK